MRPLELLDTQVNLIRWWESELGHRYAEGFKESHRGKGMRVTEQIPELEAWKLNNASTYFVSRDMKTMCWEAAKTMPGQPLKYSDLPSPFGFMFFETPIVAHDRRGKLIKWRAVSWAPARVKATNAGAATDTASVVRGRVVTQFHADDEEEVLEGTGVHLSYYSHVRDDDETWNPDERDLHLLRTNLVLMHENGWVFGLPFDDHLSTAEREGIPHQIVEENEHATRRFVACVWTVMQQRISMRTRPHLSRALFRRADRALNLPPEVIVIDLRRTLKPKQVGEDNDEYVEWSHRWIVDGHWRHQYLPSTNSHRWQWISAYVKGPEDKPLIIKDKVFRFDR